LIGFTYLPHNRDVVLTFDRLLWPKWPPEELCSSVQTTSMKVFVRCLQTTVLMKIRLFATDDTYFSDWFW